MSDDNIEPDTLHLSDSSPESSDDEYNEMEQGSRKRKRVPWTFEKVMKSQQEVDNELKDKWVKKKEYPGQNKKWYKCKIATSCPIKMHLIFVANDKITMMVNDGK